MKTISKVITRQHGNAFDKDEVLAKNQIAIAEAIADKMGYDLTTCGNCGTVQFIDNGLDSTCYQCGFVGEPCDFPSLFFDGMTIVREVKATDRFGTTLEEGDTVVVIDNEGLEEYGIKRGYISVIDEIHEHSQNYLKIDREGSSFNLYGDRLLKINK